MTSPRPTLAVALILICLLAAVAFASIDTHRVLLVVNDASPTSRAIGDYYQAVRHLPDINVCHLTTCPTDEKVAPDVWYDQIKTPIWNYLTDPAHPWLRNQIQVILLTKGVPLWFWADEWRDSSVDMPLCYLGNTSPSGAEPFGWAGRRNSYFAQDQAFEVFCPSADNHLTVEFPRLLDLCLGDSGVMLAGAATGLIFRKSGEAWSPVGDRRGGFSGTDIVALAGVGTTAWAVQAIYSRWRTYGIGGRILRSTDNGVSWREVRPRSWDTDLFDIAFADANTGWAVGSQKGKPLLLATTNGGDHQWPAVDLASLGLPDGKLTGVAVADRDTLVVCGENGTVLRGAKVAGAWTWSKLAGLPSVSYRSVAMRGPAGWIVGDGGRILVTADGGRTWREQVGGTPLPLLRVYALDAAHAWATTGTTTLLRTSNGGATWEVVSLPPGQEIQAVHFSTARDGLAVAGKSVLATTDAGATWRAEFTGPDTDWRVNYLVCRLDGYQFPAFDGALPVDIKRMIDAGLRPDRAGRFVLDQGSTGNGNGWAAQAAKTLTVMNDAGVPGIEEVVLDLAPAYLTGEKRVMGYCSWGSNDGHSHANTQWAKPRNKWLKGSLSTTYVSTSARTLNYPPDYLECRSSLGEPDAKLEGKLQVRGCWQGWFGALHDAEANTERRATAVNGTIELPLSAPITNGELKIFYSDGSEVTSARVVATAAQPIRPTQVYSIDQSPFLQSLVGDLLREGCSATIGNVTEPYLEGCGQPQYLFPRYVEGFPWAECAYMAMEWGGWREVALGDPLMAPYAIGPTVALTSPRSGAVLTSGRVYTLSADVTPSDHTTIQRVEFWLSDGKQTDAILGTATAAPVAITWHPPPPPGPCPRAAIP